MEEATPMTATDATLLAPQEVVGQCILLFFDRFFPLGGVKSERVALTARKQLYKCKLIT